MEREAEQLVVHRGDKDSTENPATALGYHAFQLLQTPISRLLAALLVQRVFVTALLLGFFGLLWVVLFGLVL